ncbi:MAG: sarcosine oxidase subunit gamma family protein [Jatrophihabitantaceae bacterium]
MAEPPQLRRSPLAGWAGRFERLAPAIELAELGCHTQLNLRLASTGPATGRLAALLGAALPSEPCRAVLSGQHQLLWLGPDEWLLVSEPATDAETTERISRLRTAIGGEHGSVTDVSGQRTILELAGPAARELLAMGCAIDLHPSVSPTGTCVQTLLAQAGVILLVVDDRAPRFRLLVRSSFAGYLAGWLLDATGGLER